MDTSIWPEPYNSVNFWQTLIREGGRGAGRGSLAAAWAIIPAAQGLLVVVASRNHAPLTCPLRPPQLSPLPPPVGRTGFGEPAVGVARTGSGDRRRRVCTFRYYLGIAAAYGTRAACVSGAGQRLSRRRFRRPRTAKARQMMAPLPVEARQHRSVKPWPCTPGRAARLQPRLSFSPPRHGLVSRATAAAFGRWIGPAIHCHAFRF
jgi:hypothetical protein